MGAAVEVRWADHAWVAGQGRRCGCGWHGTGTAFCRQSASAGWKGFTRSSGMRVCYSATRYGAALATTACGPSLCALVPTAGARHPREASPAPATLPFAPSKSQVSCARSKFRSLACRGGRCIPSNPSHTNCLLLLPPQIPLRWQWVGQGMPTAPPPPKWQHALSKYAQSVAGSCSRHTATADSCPRCQQGAARTLLQVAPPGRAPLKAAIWQRQQQEEQQGTHQPVNGRQPHASFRGWLSC